MKKILFILALSLFSASFTMAQTSSTSNGKKPKTEQSTQGGQKVTNGSSHSQTNNGKSEAAKTSKGKKAATRKKK